MMSASNTRHTAAAKKLIETGAYKIAVGGLAILQ